MDRVDLTQRPTDGAYEVHALIRHRGTDDPSPKWTTVGVFGRRDDAERCRATWERRTGGKK
jgi:hypothetical protein